jgi:hypothetical protein
MMPKCFKLKVPTTNTLGNYFKIGETFHECQDGFVHVFAKDLKEAVEQLPNAESGSDVGFGYTKEQSKNL